MKRVGLLVFGVLLLAGCGYELARTRASLGEVRRVAIRSLRNDSVEPGLGLVVTDALEREFLRRAALRLVDDPGAADLVIAGKVLPVRVRGRSFSSVNLALEYELTLRLDLTVTRRDGSEVPLDRQLLRETELFLASADVEAARKNREEALRRVAGVLAGRVHDVLVERLAIP